VGAAVSTRHTRENRLVPNVCTSEPLAAWKASADEFQICGDPMTLVARPDRHAYGPLLAPETISHEAGVNRAAKLHHASGYLYVKAPPAGRTPHTPLANVTLTANLGMYSCCVTGSPGWPQFATESTTYVCDTGAASTHDTATRSITTTKESITATRFFITPGASVCEKGGTEGGRESGVRSAWRLSE